MNAEDKNAAGVDQKELLAEDPAQTRPPTQILLEDTTLIAPDSPDKKGAAANAQKNSTPQPNKPASPDGVTQSELLEEDPAQTNPPAQILLEQTPTTKK